MAGSRYFFAPEKDSVDDLEKGPGAILEALRGEWMGPFTAVTPYGTASYSGSPSLRALRGVFQRWSCGCAVRVDGSVLRLLNPHVTAPHS